MKRIALQNQNRPCISMHKIRIGGDFARIMFPIGIIAISLIAIPQIEIVPIAFGALIGAVMWWMHR